ncbi:MAG: isoprenylcysteine carboxylmethyltransferase family protein [Candidatus Latescibacteria bacterium]|nr:isoprenylcysteine carboxylmethyltransferase family protein [Candidatus Latescibacterota bacterium]
MFIFFVIWGTWFLSEVFLARFIKSGSADSYKMDKNSLRIMWTTIITSIFAGVILMIYTNLPITAMHLTGYVGLFVIIAGMILRIIAIISLGKIFTVNLTIHRNQHIIKKGLYRFIRHPSYTGSLLSFVGLGLSFNNWASLAVIAIPVIASFIYRINVEEKLMLQQFGHEYTEYRKKTKRLIPFIY